MPLGEYPRNKPVSCAPLQVGPLIKYYQCEAAHEFMVEKVEGDRTLAALLAYESVFNDGNVQQWSAGMYEAVVQELVELEKWGKYGYQQQAPVCVYDERCYEEYGVIGNLCKQNVKESAVESLETLRPQTLVKIMQRALRQRMSIDEAPPPAEHDYEHPHITFHAINES